MSSYINVCHVVLTASSLRALRCLVRAQVHAGGGIHTTHMQSHYASPVACHPSPAKAFNRHACARMCSSSTADEQCMWQLCYTQRAPPLRENSSTAALSYHQRGSLGDTAARAKAAVAVACCVLKQRS
eukprot:21231-Heterococcus_DN1.PRE.9